MGQIIKALAFVCHGRNSHSFLMKLYTIDRNPDSKNPFVGGQNPTTPSPIFPQIFNPIMHFQWEGLNTTVTRPVKRLWLFMAQRTHLGGRYTGKVEKVYNFMFCSRKRATEFQPVLRIGNGEIVIS